MRLKVLACDVLARELYGCAARAQHTVHLALLPQGLHDNSDTCRARLQADIDAVQPDHYDAVLLGYGLCSNSLAGIRAGATRMIVPRAHDCITLLLGSKERYARLFAEVPGTYWFSAGWLDSAEEGREQFAPMANSGLGPTYRRDWNELVAKYGEENARYLADFMGQWEKHYTRGVLIEFEFTRHLGLAARVRRICEEKGWTFETVEGDLGLIQAGFDGQWDDARFLLVEPGQVVRASYDDGILAAGPPPCACGQGACKGSPA
jgi:hypothetical protein